MAARVDAVESLSRYNPYLYFVRAITCAESDLVVLPVLLFGSAHASTGADDDVTRVIVKLRARFPGIQVHVRGDSRTTLLQRESAARSTFSNG